MIERTTNFLDYSGLTKLVDEMNKKYALKEETLSIDGVTLITNTDGKTETKYKAQKIGYDEYVALVAAGGCDEFTFYYIDEGADTPTIKIGDTDISDVGDGTVTGAIKTLYGLYTLDKELNPTSAKGVENRVIANHFEKYYQKDDVPVKLAMAFNENHELTVQLKNSRGEVLSEQTRNLMIESVVVGGRFIESTGTLLLELNEGDPIQIPIASLVNGLVDFNTTIAGIDLRDDITSTELTLALEPATVSSQGMMSASDKTKLNSVSADANKVESSTNGNIKIDGVDTNVYTHPDVKHIPSGGSVGQILKYKADGEAQWAEETDTTYDEATASVSGLMPATDKTKLDQLDVDEISGAIEAINGISSITKDKIDKLFEGD